MSWPAIPIRRIFNVVNGGTPTANEMNWGGGIPWATPVDIGAAGNTLHQTQRTLTRLGVATGSRLVAEQSVLLSTRAPIGYVTRTATPMAFNQGCRALVPMHEMDVRFFVYQLGVLTGELQMRGQGTTFPELSSDSLAALPVSVPPAEEQCRIADFLDAETARIDRLVAARERQRTVFEERIFADTSETLVPDSLSAPLGQWPWIWLPRTPKNRQLVRLGYVCRLQNGLTVDGKRDVSGDVVTRPYLRVANVQVGRVALDTVTEITVPRAIAERSTLRTGDVLMTEGGDIDKLGRGTVWNGELDDCLHQNHIFALRPNNRRLDGEYLAFMMQGMHGRCYFESTGVKTTNLASTNSNKILGFPIPLPPVEEQRAIVRDLRARTESSAQVMAKLERQLALLAERRQALITAAVTGQLDVSTARGGESQ